MFVDVFTALKKALQHGNSRGGWIGVLWALFLSSVFLCSGWAQAAGCSFANSTAKGKYVPSLCFFDMSAYDDTQAGSRNGQRFRFDLQTGGTLEFVLKREGGRGLQAEGVGTYAKAPLGNGNWYAGIANLPVLYQTDTSLFSIFSNNTLINTQTTITFSDIKVTNALDSPVSGYYFLVVDGEATSPTESFTVQSNGGGWVQIEEIPNPQCGDNLKLSGVGSQTVRWATARYCRDGASAPMLVSRSPSTVEATINSDWGGRQGLAFALAFSAVELSAEVLDPHNTGSGRIVPTDQFNLSINDHDDRPFDRRGSATTVGSSAGDQTNRANVSIYFEGGVTLSESMVAGSGSSLDLYSPTLICTSTNGQNQWLSNKAEGRQIKVAIGAATFDLVKCKFTNTIPPPDVKTQLKVTPERAKAGEKVEVEVEYKNLGPSQVAGTTFSLQLDSGLTPTFTETPNDISARYEPVTGQVIFTGMPTTMAPGKSLAFNLSYVQPNSNISTIASTIHTSSTQPDGDQSDKAEVTVSSAQIKVSKTVDKTEASVGDTLSWTITARNKGTIPNTGVIKLTDFLPAHIQVTEVKPDEGVSCPPLENWAPGGLPVCTISAGQLAENSALEVVFSARVTGAGELSNQITAEGPDQPQCKEKGACETKTSVSGPQLIVSTTAKETSAKVGDVLRWTIQVQNNSDSGNTGEVTLINTLAEHLSDVSAKPVDPITCEPITDRTLACTIPSAFFGKKKRTAVIDVKGTASKAGEYTNTVTASGPDEPECRKEDCTAKPITVTGPQVHIQKTANQARVDIDEPLGWLIAVSNTGDGSTTGAITLIDTLPAYLRDVTVIQQTSAHCEPIQNNILTCTVPEKFEAGSTATIEIQGKASRAGQYINTVKASGVDNPECTPDDCTAKPITVTHPRITVKKEARHRTDVQIGDPLRWIITVRNLGDAPTGDDITLIDRLPPGLSDVQTTASSAHCDPIQDRILSCTVPAGLAEQQGVATIEVRGTAATAGKYDNIVVPRGIDGLECEEGCSITPMTSVEPPPRLVVSQTPYQAQQAEADEKLSWAIQLENTGAGPSSAPLQIEDLLPEHLKDSTFSVSPAGAASCAQRGRLLTCTVPAGFEAGQQVKIEVGGTATQAGTFVNTVVPSGPDAPECGNGCSLTPIEVRPRLVVSQTPSQAQQAEADEKLSWAIQLENTGVGPSSAPLQIEDLLPEHLKDSTFLVSPAGAASCAQKGRLLTCTVPAGFEAGQQVKIEVGGTATQAGTFVNTVVPSGADAPECGDGCSLTPIEVRPRLIVSQTPSQAQQAEVDGKLSWAIQLENTGAGPSSAALQIEDLLPEHLKDSTFSVSPVGAASCAQKVRLLTCTVPAGFEAGQQVKIEVGGTATQAGTFVNTVVPSGPDAPECGNGCSLTPIEVRPRLVVSQTPSQAQEAEVGQKLNWAIQLENTGAGPSSAPLQIEDLLPEHLKDSTFSVSPAGAASCAQRGRLLTCTVPAGFEAGKTLEITVSGVANKRGSFFNTVVPSGADAPECGDGCSLTPIEWSALVMVRNIANHGKVLVNGELHWTIKAYNEGDGPTQGVITLTDVLPEHLADVRATSSDAACEPVREGRLVCTIPAGLAAEKGVATIEIRGRATQAGQYVNVVEPSGIDALACPLPTRPAKLAREQLTKKHMSPAEASSCVATTEVVGAPNITIKKNTHQQSAHIGDSLRWTITARNSGTSASASVVTLTDTLPEHLSDVSVTPAAPAICAPLQNRTLTCTVPSGFKPGQTASIEVQGTATASGFYINTVVPSGADAPQCAEGECSATTQVVSPQLVMSKRANKSTAEIGASVLYTIEVKNQGTLPVNDVSVIDRLPAGFRYIGGTTVRNDTVIEDPQGQPGPQLQFKIGRIEAGETLRYRYRVRIGVGAQQGDGTNRAQARPPAGPASNEARSTVKVIGGVFGTQACVVGKVFVDCNQNQIQDAEEPGIPGVRLYLEDGTHFTTDLEGKYSYCGLSPKSHVIKVDPITLPPGSHLTTTSNRNLGDPNSLFLDVKNGELIRADFAEGSCANTILEQIKVRRAHGKQGSTGGQNAY